MKKVFTLLFALATSVGTLFVQSCTDGEPTASGTCGDNLTWNLTNGVLTISGSGDMKNWSPPSLAPWFSYWKNITSVTIVDSVTSIGSYAFYECSSLRSVTIPNSVTRIGDKAFLNCSGLSSLTIGGSVTSIGVNAFRYCTGLSSVVVENGNTIYDSRDNCNAIIETSTNKLRYGCKNTIIPNSVTCIGVNAFAGCSGLTSVTIPNSVTRIEYQAFQYCSGLRSITCNADVPPTCQYGVVFGGVKKSIPVYVPANSVEAYKAALGWKEFNIVGQ